MCYCRLNLAPHALSYMLNHLEYFSVLILGLTTFVTKAGLTLELYSTGRLEHVTFLPQSPEQLGSQVWLASLASYTLLCVLTERLSNPRKVEA